MPSPDPRRPGRGSRIDRRAVVRRHAVELTGVDPAAPLSVGNGELCATVDVTGLQTFPAAYPVTDPAGGPAGTLLGTQAQWGWHSVPPPPGGADLHRALRPYRTWRGEVPFVDSPPLPGGHESGLDEGLRWLRANPHRLDLARIGFVLPDGPGFRAPELAELGACHQSLDPWTGLIESDVELAGRRLRVTTACHPERDVLAVCVGSAGAGTPAAAVRIAFPYGSQSWSNAADWTRPDAHASRVEPVPGGVLVHRLFDGAHEPLYRVRVAADGGTVRVTGDHELVVEADGPVLRVVVAFAEDEPAEPPQATAVFAAAVRHWRAFWERGAAIDLAGSTDPRAAELERRIVLSRYLTAIQCAGSLPPQETGLTCNSWRGRFHLEMHWWHAAHFALWGTPDLLRRSMDCYRRFLPAARETARRQGCRGARWPKQVGPDGRESPSHIGPFLLWQQPHVVHLAELLRRAGDPEAEQRYGDLVEATAWFMADVAEPTAQGYALGPPLVPAQESYAEVRDRIANPPFELAYWAWGLRVAQEWKVRAGRPPEPLWDEVAKGMAAAPVRDGRYCAVALFGTEPFTVPADHPSMVYGLGPVPATDALDQEIVRRTLHAVLDEDRWDWGSTWGWDFPALAMTATRLHEPETAVAALLRDTPKNRHLVNGHNRQTDTLPLYLPGNGGLLAAVALMAAGFDGDGGVPTPGFPRDGTWVVRHEGFVRSP